MRGPATAIMRRCGHEPFCRRKGFDDAPQQMPAHARAADRHDADRFVGLVAEFCAQRRAIRELRRIEPRDVAGKIEMRVRSNRAMSGQIGAERAGNDVVGVADEDRAVAQPRIARDLLDHLRVVVGREKRFAVAAVGHGDPADEIGHPDVRRAFLFGVLVQEIVELPGFVADPEIVRLVAHDVVEDHEVVRPGSRPCAASPGTRAGRARPIRSRCAALARQKAAGRVDALAFAPRARAVTGSCASQSISRSGCRLAQFARDRDVALRVAQADGRRDVQRAPRRRARRPALASGLASAAQASRSTKSRMQQVDLHRLTAPQHVAAVLDHDVARRRSLRPPRAPRVGETSLSCSPWMTSTGHVDLAVELGELPDRRASASPDTRAHRRSRASVCGVVSSPQPTQSSICLVECGSYSAWPKKNSRKSR